MKTTWIVRHEAQLLQINRIYTVTNFGIKSVIGEIIFSECTRLLSFSLVLKTEWNIVKEAINAGVNDVRITGVSYYKKFKSNTHVIVCWLHEKQARRESVRIKNL